MKLECIRPCVMGDGMVTTTVGKVYDVQYETSFGYVIKDDLGDLHEFTHSPYKDRLDYTYWFKEEIK